MKILILFFLCFISELVSGQVMSSVKMDKIIIDSHLSDPLFNANKHTRQKFTTVSVVTTDSSGNKKDGNTQVSDEIDVIINSKVIDVDHHHYRWRDRGQSRVLPKGSLLSARNIIS